MQRLLRVVLVLFVFAGVLIAQAPTPSISFVSPGGATAGASDTTISVFGGVFTTSGAAVVFFDPPGATGRTALATSAVNSGQLTAIIPAGLLTTIGTGAVDMQNGPGGPISNQYPFEVNTPISISPVSLPNTTVGTNYAQSVIASGGAGFYNFQISSGSLPPGLNIDSGGTISGLTTAPGGPFAFTVMVSDFQGGSATRNYSITVNPVPVITSTTLPATTVGATYNQTLAVSGGTPPFTFNEDGGMPPGIALSSSGVLTGSLERMDQIKFAVLENSGGITIIPR